MKDTDYKTSAINAIVDLFALGLSNELHFMNITAGYPSGFSILAKHLNENKKIIFNLLKMGRWERWKQSWHSH